MMTSHAPAVVDLVKVVFALSTLVVAVVDSLQTDTDQCQYQLTT